MDSKGKYGVIEYRTAEDCYSACRMLDGTMIGSCKVRVYEVKVRYSESWFDKLIIPGQWIFFRRRQQ